MAKDILQYKAELERKLQVVNEIIADMGSNSAHKSSSGVANVKVDGRRRKRGPMSAAAKAKLGAKMKQIWAKRKATAKK
jgi:hypothetical protein